MSATIQQVWNCLTWQAFTICHCSLQILIQATNPFSSLRNATAHTCCVLPAQPWLRRRAPLCLPPGTWRRTAQACLQGTSCLRPAQTCSQMCWSLAHRTEGPQPWHCYWMPLASRHFIHTLHTEIHGYYLQASDQSRLIYYFYTMYRVIHILGAATDGCCSRPCLAWPPLHGASNCRCSQTLTPFFSHCNTGNFVNTPVHVNKTMPRR